MSYHHILDKPQGTIRLVSIKGLFFHSFDEYATTGIFNEYTESVDWKAANFGSPTQTGIIYYTQTLAHLT